ncbi:hypothetical protein PGB90_010455 [Kerria lacca]
MPLQKIIRNFRHILNKRSYSQYAKSFIRPIIKESDIQNITESKKINVLKNLNVKPPQNWESSSILNEVVLLKFTNYIMRDGKREIALTQLKKALEIIKKIQVEQYNKTTDEEERKQIILDPIRIVKQAVANCQPLLKLCPIRRGGSVYQVPVPISDTESVFRAMKWIVESSKEKEGPTPFALKLAHELLDASKNKGRVIKKKIELHRICEANRAYAHFRWG